ncbi:hypothetical protein Plhal304r1_c103g0175451 [Plasmopara halstedii]
MKSFPGISAVLKCLRRLHFLPRFSVRCLALLRRWTRVPHKHSMVYSTKTVQPFFPVDQSNTQVLIVDLVAACLVQHLQCHTVTQSLREVAAH